MIKLEEENGRYWKRKILNLAKRLWRRFRAKPAEAIAAVRPPKVPSISANNEHKKQTAIAQNDARVSFFNSLVDHHCHDQWHNDI